MRLKQTIPLLLISLLLASFCACISRSDKCISIDIMKSVPSNSTSLVYWKINTLGTDEELEIIYDKFKYSDEITQLKDIGVKRADIEQIGRASGLGQTAVTIITGKMDISSIEVELDKHEGYERKDYELDHNRGASIWLPADTEANKSIAVRGSIVLMGDRADIIECVDVIALDEEYSLNHDVNTTSLVDKLPNGVLVYIDKAGSDPEEVYTDLIVYGKSYAKQGDEELKLTAVYMFDNYFAAKDAQDAIMAYLSDNGFVNPEVKMFDEIYIRATAVINIADFADVLNW